MLNEQFSAMAFRHGNTDQDEKRKDPDCYWMPMFGNEATLIPSSPWSLRILVAYSFILTLSLCTFAILYPFHAFLNAPQLWPVVKSPLFPVRSSDMLFMLLRVIPKGYFRLR